MQSDRDPTIATPLLASVPARLIDPDGEGIYLNTLVEHRFGFRRAAAWELFGDPRRWRDVEWQTVWFKRESDDLWRPIPWRWWRGLLPRFGGAVPFAYLTAKEGSQ